MIEDKTFRDKARSVLQHSGLMGGGWGEVFLTVSYGPISGMMVTPQEL